MKDSPSAIIAKGTLHDRGLRRKMLLQVLIVLLAAVVIGHWVLGSWLGEGIVRFLLWWGGVAFLTVFVLLFAVYDALRVVQEEREKALKELAKSAEDLMRESGE